MLEITEGCEEDKTDDEVDVGDALWSGCMCLSMLLCKWCVKVVDRGR